MKAGVRRGLVTAGFAALLGIWALNFWVQRQAFARLQHAQKEVCRLKDTRTELLMLTNAYTDAETGQRGYLLTGDEAHLSPYLAARARLETLAAHLTSALGSNEGLRALLQSGQAKLDELQRTIQLRQAGRPEAALAIVRTGLGKRLMDQIREAERRLQAGLEVRVVHILQSAKHQKRQSERMAWLTQGLRGGVLLSFYLVVRWIWREREQVLATESEERFRQLAENISEVFWMRDPVKDQVLYVSPAYETLWGRSRQSLYASPQSWLEAIHPEDHERVRQAAQRRQAAGTYDEEYRIVRPDGAIRWVRDRAFPVRGTAGQADRVVGVAQDVTASKQAEAERRHRREARFRSLIEHASDLITVLNSEGLIRFQSPSLERVLGYPPAELLGRSAFELVHPEDLPQAQAAFQRALLEPSATISFECRFRHRHGQWRLLQSSGRALPDEGGAEALAVLNSRDVTEQKHLEAQLRQAQKMEALGRLAGGVAHDFNNLLAVIVGHAELLERGLPQSERLGDSVAEIGRAAERAAALTRQLLTFSRQQVLELRALDLNAAVSAAEQMLRRLIGEDVRLTTNLQPNLSPVWADAGQLDQVLLNLAVNARDAMPHGGTLSFETRTVELSPTHGHAPPKLRPGRYVLLAVSDTGCGMDPEVQARVFEPFFTTKGIGQGSGLGLAVVHGIIEQCGGHAEVYSLPGLGTTFKIYLPVVEGLTVQASERGPDKPPPQGHGETVLLVEDEAPVRAVTLLLLESLGYRVLEAASAEEALRLAQAGREKIELLMSDVIMPGKNGHELAEALRRRDPGLKVLFQSGYAGEMVARHGIAEAETAFLQKPFTLEALAKKVREVLDQA